MLSDKFNEIMDYLIFGSIRVIFGLIIYYYLVPRYWLDGIIKYKYDVILFLSSTSLLEPLSVLLPTDMYYNFKFSK